MEDQVGPSNAMVGSTRGQPWGVTFATSHGGFSLALESFLRIILCFYLIFYVLLEFKIKSLFN